MRFYKFVGLFILVLLIQSCASGKSDLDEMLRVMEQDDPQKFEKVMTDFVDSARQGDVERMISLTSNVTIEKMGREKLKKHYQNDISPGLKACKSISSGGDIIHVDKHETGTGSGWVYRKTCITQKDKPVRIQFIVLNENGRIALTSVNAL